jgi:ELWxxDGT repeat protein
MRNETFLHQPMKRLRATIAMALLALVAGLPSARGTAITAGGFAHLVKDINTTSLSSEPHAMVTVENLVYFMTRDGQERASLWKSDGTAAGTAHIADNVYPGYQNLHVMNSTLFFRGRDDELWRTDGTLTGTLLLAKGIYAGCCSTLSEASLFANIDRMSFFIAQDGSGGQALWRSDGTASGTVQVKQLPAQVTATGAIATGTIPPSIGDIVFADLEQVDGTLFFAINGKPVPAEYGLWKSDGTEAGTVPVKKIVARDLFSSTACSFCERHRTERLKHNGVVEDRWHGSWYQPSHYGCQP